MSLRLCLLVLLLVCYIPCWSRASENHELGIKLCGREFIRTVVMSCGGSRWKRYSPEPGQERNNPYRELLNWLNMDFVEDPENLNMVHGQKRSQASSTGLRALTMEQLQDFLYDPLEVEEQQDVQLRMKRSTGPAGSCCQRGCTKTELMKFC